MAEDTVLTIVNDLEIEPKAGESLRSRAFRRFRRHRLAMISSGFLAFLILVAIGAPLVSLGRSYYRPEPSVALQSPSAEHIMGTDQIGRDVWARLIYGSRVSLAVGIIAVSLSIAISIVLGTISGFYGGVVDNIIMRVTDIMMVFPGFILIMTVVVVLGPSIFNIMAVIGLLGWTGTTRLLRGQILTVREWDFVLAARSVGVPDRRIMVVHVLPNALAPLLVAATFGIAGAILTEAGLSFLGFGVKPPTPSWGQMLNAAMSIVVLEQYWWLWIPPGIAVLLTVLAINFMGDGLRDALDPRMTLN